MKARSHDRSSTRGLLAAAVAWTLAWKGASLWQAAKDGSRPWFIALLLSNTLGILDAIYIFGVSPDRPGLAREEAAVRARTGEPEQLGHTQET